LLGFIELSLLEVGMANIVVIGGMMGMDSREGAFSDL